jgi:hypothetical protein
MLVIHWTEQNNISDILANGIRPSSQQRSEKKVRGIWCYPYTRNKVLNNTWKRQLKAWLNRHANFNGVVFRLEEIDFPLQAGPFWLTNNLGEAQINCPTQLEELLKSFPATKELPVELDLVITDYEIILQKLVTPNRIIKIIKDREPKNNA